MFRINFQTIYNVFHHRKELFPCTAYYDYSVYAESPFIYTCCFVSVRIMKRTCFYVETAGNIIIGNPLMKTRREITKKIQNVRNITGVKPIRFYCFLPFHQVSSSSSSSSSSLSLGPISKNCCVPSMLYSSIIFS